MENNQNLPQEPVVQPSQPTVVSPNTEPQAGQLPSAMPEPTAPQSAPADQPQVIGPALTAETYTDGNPAHLNPQGQVIGPSQVPKRKLRLSKPALITAVTVLVLLGGSAAAYFGYYAPNQPDNLWKTALSRTGKGYDQLTNYSLNQFKTNNSGIKLDGSFKVSGGIAADGTFSGGTDKNNGEFTGSISAGGIKVNADLRLIKSATSTPDIYFKVDGIQGLGDLVGSFVPQYASALNDLNGNWYFVDHSLFDQFSQGTGNSLQVTSDDVSSVLKAISNANKQNIFTADPTKSAFSVQQNVGKEKQDNRNVYHYVVGINKNNLKAYVTSLCNNLKNSSLKKFFGSSQSASDSIGCSTAAASVQNFDANRTADVWVDTHTKLIHKIRITDSKDKDNYFDISQDYQGGNSYPFALNFHSKDSSSQIGLTLNTKLNSLNLTAKSQESGEGGFNATAALNLAPSHATLSVQKPAKAKNIIQLLNDLGISQIYQGVQTQAKDTERKTDINALQGQLEAYQADNGFYPTLADINTASWREINMKGLDAEALKDPDGTSAALTSSLTPHTYAYVVAPAGCDNLKVQCTSYTLTASLDSGGTYLKQSLN